MKRVLLKILHAVFLAVVISYCFSDSVVSAKDAQTEKFITDNFLPGVAAAKKEQTAEDSIFSSGPVINSSQTQIVEKPREISREAFKLGAVLPLTGEMADYGKKAKNGIDLAVKIFNNENKTNISVVYSDSEGKEPLEKSTAVSSLKIYAEDFYRSAESDRLTLGIIGPVINASLPDLAELSETYRVPTISPLAFSSKKIKDAQYFFSNSVSPEDEGRNIAGFTVNVLKKKKAAVIYPKSNPYGTACALAFKEELLKLGGEVTREETFNEGSYDFKEQMINLGGIDPHIIKNIIEADKSNLESIVTKLVAQIRALFPDTAGKKRKNIVLVEFINSGREKEKLLDDFDFGQIISEKLSYGLGKNKDTRLPKIAEVKAFIRKNGFKKETLAKKFDADIIISGSVSEKNPLSYNCKVVVQNLAEKSSAEVLFDFTASDKLVTNPYELETVYLPVNAYDAESILSHLVFFELRVPYLGNSRMNDKQFIANIIQNEGELYFTTEFNPASTVPKTADFVRAYEDTYFEVPDYFSAAAYDAAGIFLDAIGKGACSKEDVKQAIKKISALELVTGNTSYDGAFLKKDMHINGIKDKELIEIK